MSEQENKLGNEEVKKTIPSILENKFADFTYKFAKFIPNTVSPNTVTAIGLLLGLLGALCLVLGQYCKWLYIVSIVGIIAHIVADNLDGYMARTRKQCSDRGAYFDLLSDILFTTAMMFAYGYSEMAHLEFSTIIAPMYGIYSVIALYYTSFYNEFPFPSAGPFEFHFMMVVTCVLSIIWGPITLFTINNYFNFTIVDAFLLIAAIFMFIEIAKLGFQLFFRLKKDNR